MSPSVKQCGGQHCSGELTFTNFKTYCKSVVIKIVILAKKIKGIETKERVQNPEINPSISAESIVNNSAKTIQWDK